MLNARAVQCGAHGSPRRAVTAAALTVAMSAGCAPITAQETGGPVQQACRLVVRSSLPVQDVDGSPITINASSAATKNGIVLFAGTPTLRWRIAERGSYVLEPTPGWVGVTRDAQGGVHLVPLPPGHRDLAEPRVSAAGRGGWHFVFVRGRQGALGNALSYERADIWYAHWDGMRWGRVERIAVAQNAMLTAGLSTELVEAGGRLAFSYAFDNPNHDTSASRGVVMLTRRRGAWHADTLKTWDAPRSIQMMPLDSATFRLVFAQSFFERGRPRGPALFAVDYSETWSSPRVLLELSPQYVVQPTVAPQGHGDAVLSWRTAQPGVDNESLERGWLSSGGVFTREGSFTTVMPMDRPAVMTVGTRSTLWFARSGSARDTVRAFLAAPGVALQDLGSFAVPFENFSLIGAAPTHRSVVLLSGGRMEIGGVMSYASFLTALSVSCPPAATENGLAGY